MKRFLSIMLASSALCGAGLAEAAYAADASSAVQQGTTSDDQGDIVVNARRKAELMSDVPQTVNAVKGNELQELDLFEFGDLSKVVSGLTLDPTDEAINMRGVSFNVTAQTNPTTSTYINEAPVQSAMVFQSLFDIGQIEVLKGPQGTTRGQSAPTGAITLTTHRPDLYGIGGYAMGSASDQDSRVLQGAINVPVIEGKFALRFAGDVDHNNNGGIKSANSSTSPYSDTDAFRVSARAEPIENLSVNFTYQHLTFNSLGFGSAVFGNGSPGTSVAAGGYGAPFVPAAGYNGPVIPIGTRLAVAEQPDLTNTHEQFATGQVDYDTNMFKVSYIGSWEKLHALNIHPGDTGNQVLGDFPGRNLTNATERWTHELRVSSVERIAGIADVVAGVFHLSESNQTGGLTALAAFFPGAFGSPTGAPVATAPNLRYALPIDLAFNSHNSEWSYYGNVTLHLDSKTELSGGIRFIHDTRNSYQAQLAATPYAAAAMPALYCGFVPGGVYGTTYPGVCDIPISIPASVSQTNVTSTPKVYSATLSHHFTPELMSYFNFGTSWRPGFVQSSVVNISNDPTLAALSNLKDETTTSYEVGLIGSTLDHRINASIAYYHQNYKNFVLSQQSGINYLIYTGPSSPPSPSTLYGLSSNVNATVDGIDLDASVNITHRWSVDGNLSWANGRFKNQSVPCNGTIPAGQYIALCQTSGSPGSSSDWNMTIRSDYSHPLTKDLDVFAAGIFTYSPKNPNYDPQYVVPAYALVNINLGVRNPQQGWELQAFVKNLTNNSAILDKSTLDAGAGAVIGTLGTSGYQNISYQNPREFGVTFRYSFGKK